MKDNHHTLLLLLTALIAAAFLLIAGIYMKRASERFDQQHPELDNPLQSETVPDTGGMVPGTDGNVPGTNGTVPDTDGNVPGSGGAVPGTDGNVPGTDGAVPGTGGNVPGTGGNVPDTNQGEAASGMDTPGSDSQSPEGSSSGANRAANNISEETEAEMPEQDRLLPDHRIIFVGDSRTIGMQNAMTKLLPDDLCVYVGKVGEGCSWFLAEGEAEMGMAIAQFPDAPVVLNFGVNDPDQIEQYLDAYKNMMETWPDTDFYFLSVNPVQRAKMIENGVSEEALGLVTNANILKLNTAFEEAWPGKYLDSSTMLKTTGFETIDGLHYNRQTYLKIHRFVVEELTKRKLDV